MYGWWYCGMIFIIWTTVVGPSTQSCGALHSCKYAVPSKLGARTVKVTSDRSAPKNQITSFQAALVKLLRFQRICHHSTIMSTSFFCSPWSLASSSGVGSISSPYPTHTTHAPSKKFRACNLKLKTEEIARRRNQVSNPEFIGRWRQFLHPLDVSVLNIKWIN